MMKFKVTFNKDFLNDSIRDMVYEYEGENIVRLALSLNEQFRADQLEKNLKSIEVVSEFAQP
ncbi:MAG TPA: hypothetical protein PLI62_00420 [Spirochaetota bacterium]|nr:hypothetical protein [Spirochaetota bacterium]